MPIFVFSIFLSAFLLFQVQPMVARYILPWYGGSPAVWTTCMLFFQLGLLGGYAYAHWLASTFRTDRKWQLIIHLMVILLACCFIPITPSIELRPTGSEVSNVWSIVELLARTVGLPYLVMAASGPLLQHWFSGAFPRKSPYRLYAVSNIGSLLGLLSYPFLFQPKLGLKHQTWLWSGSFIIYGILALLCAYAYYVSNSSTLESRSPFSKLKDRPSIRRKFIWVILSAFGSTVLLSITNQMSQDISVTPYLWVLPLAIYLLTFIISFDRTIWYQRLLWIPLMIASIYLLGSMLNIEFAYHRYTILTFACAFGLATMINLFIKRERISVFIFLVALATIIPVIFLNRNLGEQFMAEEIHIYWQLGIFLATIFTVCMVCHGELVALKPSNQHLTSFYLYMSFGGALGGAFISLVAPLLFDGYWELHILLIALPLLIGLIITMQFKLDLVKRYLAMIITFGVTAFLFFPFAADYSETKESIIESRRSFHGVVHVYEENEGQRWHVRSMYHGQICHGLQYLHEDSRNKPNAYYTMDSGVGAVMRSIPQRRTTERQSLKMGVIGLGSGTMATHAKSGDQMVFYEINDEVINLANTYFTYLQDCAGTSSVVLGDARTSMEQELLVAKPHQLDLLFIDAFSGDSIPIHLLTKEAFEIYFKHLKPDGAIVAHITNLHIELSDPIRQLADKFNKQSFLVVNAPIDDYYSEWVIITDNQNLINNLESGNWITPWENEKPDEIHWTDDYSNLLDVIIPLKIDNNEDRLE